VDKRIKAIERFTPLVGFNVVGLDELESDPECELYLVGWCATREAADELVAERRREDPDEILFIYGPSHMSDKSEIVSPKSG
jgi:hypothetical protein